MCPCAAGAGAHHHHVDLAVALVKDFLRGAVVVSERVPGIAVLQCKGHKIIQMLLRNALLIRPIAVFSQLALFRIHSFVSFSLSLSGIKF